MRLQNPLKACEDRILINIDFISLPARTRTRFRKFRAHFSLELCGVFFYGTQFVSLNFPLHLDGCLGSPKPKAEH